MGVPARHAGFGRLDTPESILANKVTALLDREEPCSWFAAAPPSGSRSYLGLSTRRVERTSSIKAGLTCSEDRSAAGPIIGA